jgi:hypothetical protein
MKRLAIAKLLPALLGCASAASAVDLELGAYVHLPFGKDETVFGLSAKPIFQRNFDQESSPSSDPYEAGLHIQTGPDNAPVVMLNGVALSRPQALNQDGKTDAEDGQGVDWHLVAAVAIGVGLVAAVAKSDGASVSACSGQNCPPPNPEPDEPEGD